MKSKKATLPLNYTKDIWRSLERHIFSIVIDEIQLRPDLFPALRELVDRRDFQGQFLILGSTFGKLLWQSSESLAGQQEILYLRGFGLQGGGFSCVYLADSDARQVWLGVRNSFKLCWSRISRNGV